MSAPPVTRPCRNLSGWPYKVTALSDVPVAEGVTVSRRTRRVSRSSCPSLPRPRPRRLRRRRRAASDDASGDLELGHDRGRRRHRPRGDLRRRGRGRRDHHRGDHRGRRRGDRGRRHGRSPTSGSATASPRRRPSAPTTRARRRSCSTVDEQALSPLFVEALEGQTVGSRVAVAATAEEAFGDAGQRPARHRQQGHRRRRRRPARATVARRPRGRRASPPRLGPEIVEKDGVPTGLRLHQGPEAEQQARSRPP